MAEVSFHCPCGQRFVGVAAVLHASKCEVRMKQSKLHAVCTEMRSGDLQALLVEMMAEVMISSNEQLSADVVERVLTETGQHHGRFVNQKDDVIEPSPLLQPQEDTDTKTCVICGALKTITIGLGCGHTTCEVHFGRLLAEGKCEMPNCEHRLTVEERKTVKEELGVASPTLTTEEDKTACNLCGIPQTMNALLFLDCLHNICRAHIAAAFEAQYLQSSTVQCPMADCQYLLSSPEIEAVVGVDKLAEADTATALKLVRELSSVVLVTCTKCGFSGGLEKGKIDFNFKDAKGQKISEEAAVYMSKHRFRCPNCSSTMCATCGVTPYHDAFNCESYRQSANRPLCRSCKKPLEGEQCQDAECIARSQNGCGKTLQCGHLCYGAKDEVLCPPCLKCTGAEGDYCVICHCEELSSAPCVKLECNHLLHIHCLETILGRRWLGPRITFKFAKCPSCSAWVQSASLPPLSERVQSFIDLHALIQEKAVKRLEFEKEDQLPRLSDPSDPYYQQPAKYAMDRFCYYECFKCKHPYFGGKRDCQLQEQERVYNPEELVCAKCTSYLGGATDCPKHGEDFVQFKCKYCCELAVWFCWGTTHFCEPCHNIWEQRRDATKEELPQCPGMPLCPLQIAHPPNGEEFGLGCVACKDELAKTHQEF